VSQTVQILLEDDLDGTQAAETITFGLDGVSYEIDLNEDHATTFRAAFEPFAAAARSVKTTTRKTRVRNTRPDNEKIRAWAKEHGMPVNDRGRLPASVVAEYEAANASPEEVSTIPEDMTPETPEVLEVTTAEVVE
jgi:hypothetical protein